MTSKKYKELREIDVDPPIKQQGMNISIFQKHSE